MTPAEPDTRTRIITAAAKLFYRNGIRAVSVDAVAEAAGLTKRTLYYHFTSKDELIAAYLSARDQPNLALFQRWFAEAEGCVAAKLQGVFARLADAAGRPSWIGCAFLRTAAELANMPGHPAIKAGVTHKKRVEAWFAAELASAGHAQAQGLARQVAVLLDGAFAAALMHRDPAYIRAAGDAVFVIVTAARGGLEPPPTLL